MLWIKLYWDRWTTNSFSNVINIIHACDGAISTRETESAEQSQVLQHVCLSYFGGSAIAPTLDCFSGLIQAIRSNTCSCIIIKGIDDSYLGLKIHMACAFGTDIVLVSFINFVFINECKCTMFHFRIPIQWSIISHS